MSPWWPTWSRNWTEVNFLPESRLNIFGRRHDDNMLSCQFNWPWSTFKQTAVSQTNKKIEYTSLIYLSLSSNFAQLLNILAWPWPWWWQEKQSSICSLHPFSKSAEELGGKIDFFSFLIRNGWALPFAQLLSFENFLRSECLGTSKLLLIN